MRNLLVGLGVLLCCASFVGAADLALVTDGKSDYTIVLPANATPAERRGAEELRKHLKEMSGADLPIGADDQPLPQHAILLGGSNRHLTDLGVKLDAAKFGDEGFVLRTAGDHLVVAGTGKRGTMYGCTTLLERLGVRWFTPSVTRVPQRRTVTLAPLDETQVPAFEYREP
jgi:alpha-glucuronidase